MQKKWCIHNDMTNNDTGDLSGILLKILNNRGLRDENEIEKFLYSSIDDLHDPYLLKDMEKAVKILNEAFYKNEKIIVFGDYDVDGISSTTLLYRYLKDEFNYNLDIYLPNRKNEGYGLSIEAIKGFCQANYDLLITVDCGITAIEEINYANKMGLDVIVTDHHQPGDIIPEARAIIDPHQSDDQYPFKYLAGVGVAFKLCQALEYSKSNKYISQNLLSLLDIVTLGTVADIVSLTGENRIIVKKGLELINKTKNIGLKKLIDKVSLANKKIGTGHIGYIIAPHLNAAGRIYDPKICVELLITEDADIAEQIAAELSMINKERQQLEQEILEEAIEMVETQLDLEKEKAIILESKNWNHGVIGIVASKLLELYYRPTILIAVDQEGIGKGSCRSINGLNIYNALSDCADNLQSFGGHKMAAGLTIDLKDIPDFKRAFNDILNNYLDEEDLIPELYIDTTLRPTDINMELYDDLSLLEPYGIGNPRPRFILSDVKINNAYKVGKDKSHLKFSLNNGIEGIAFGFGEKVNDFFDKKLDLAFHLEINEWNNKKVVQLFLEDYKLRNVAKYYPVEYREKGISFYDKRNCQDIIEYFKRLIKLKGNFLVYINNLKIYQYVKEKIDSELVFLARTRSEFIEIKQKQGILFFTTNISKEFNISEKEDCSIEDLIFLSLPFSLKEMGDFIKLLGVSKIHLLYSGRDVNINKELIKKKVPSARYLRQLYLYLKTYPEKNIVLDRVKEIINSDGKLFSNKCIINKSVEILEELGLVEIKGSTICILPEPGKKLDLSSSIRYNNNVNIIKRYNYFVELALDRDLYILADKIKDL